MNDRIREENTSNEVHIVIISDVPDTARKLKDELEQNGYKVSIATDRDTQISLRAGGAILRVTYDDDANLLISGQQRDSVFEIVEKEGSQSALRRDKFSGDYGEIIGESSQIFEVLQQIEDLAATPLRVLISGETGTGKGLVARALHENSGRSGEMVSINCAAIPVNLLESELFGHERGAFTSADARRIGRFERAHNGTLFLDEIVEMPLSMQPKLLRAIEEGEIERVGGEKPIAVDVRIVAATNKDLARAVKDGIFREDLYYRLNVASISLPMLSERKEDICVLVSHFLEKYRRFSSPSILQIAKSTRALLETYPWPGNVRELENAIERASYLIKKGVLLPEHLPEEITAYQRQPVDVSKEISTFEDEQKVSVPLGTKFDAMEEAFIRTTLEWHDGNRTKTAETLGIGIRTLQRKLKKYNA